MKKISLILIFGLLVVASARAGQFASTALKVARSPLTRLAASATGLSASLCLISKGDDNAYYGFIHRTNQRNLTQPGNAAENVLLGNDHGVRADRLKKKSWKQSTLGLSLFVSSLAYPCYKLCQLVGPSIMRNPGWTGSAALVGLGSYAIKKSDEYSRRRFGAERGLLSQENLWGLAGLGGLVGAAVYPWYRIISKVVAR